MKNEIVLDILEHQNNVLIFAHASQTGTETVVRLNDSTLENISNAIEAVCFSQLNQFNPDRIVVSSKNEHLIPETARLYMYSTHVNLAYQEHVAFSNRLMNEKICRYSSNIIVRLGGETC